MLYDIINHTSKNNRGNRKSMVCITWESVGICYTYLNRIVPKSVHILVDSSSNNFCIPTPPEESIFDI